MSRRVRDGAAVGLGPYRRRRVRIRLAAWAGVRDWVGRLGEGHE